MIRHSLIIAITLFQTHILIASHNAELLVISDLDKALYGHSFLNISNVTMENCLKLCLENCFCLSFQLCASTKMTDCHLCSSNKYLKPLAMGERQGCSSYNFENPAGTEIINQQCGSGCATFVNCCMTSNPCLNGGTCLLPSSSSNNYKRFRCKCPDDYVGDRCEILQCKPGYTGEQCDYPITSCRGYDKGNRTSGKYIILDAQKKPFQAYCDFDSDSTMTWTLLQSYQLTNKLQMPFSVDSPQNEDDPSWSKYRLSKSRMESIQQDSTKWRITCRYETDGVVNTDYVRASNAQVNVMTLSGDGCRDVEFINIRGHHCTDCKVFMVQRKTLSKVPLHIDSFRSTKDCKFSFAGSKLCKFGPINRGEDSFGSYKCSNDKHRCSSSDTATTQTWFGGK